MVQKLQMCAQCGEPTGHGVINGDDDTNECEVCGAEPLCDLCLMAHEEDDEHWPPEGVTV